MADEPRNNVKQVPLYMRASDRDIFDCPGKWLLQYIEADKLPEAGWFMLGNVVHETIEYAILEDWSLEEALESAQADFEAEVGMARGNVLWASKRGEEQSLEILLEAVRRWYDVVHPDGDNRFEVFADYEWPPTPELLVSVDARRQLEGPATAGIRTELDSLFIPRKGVKRSSPMIVDWKTGSKAKASDTQLHMYYYGARLQGHIKWDAGFRGGFVHLGAGKEATWQEASAYPGDLNMKAMFEAVRALKQTLREGDVMFRRDWWCGSCRAKEVCPVEGSGDIVGIRARALTDVEWIEEPIDGFEEVV